MLAAAASVDAHIIGWADDWEVSGATGPMTRPKPGPWLRDENGPYDGLVAAAVDRLGQRGSNRSATEDAARASPGLPAFDPSE
ncbi:hypothetical protein [Streptomyces sp. 061-3]|uniref:hypothetical protein n=1 Tax=Streptomyces sp. 061-3 TaxID=2789268 RepID=UPI00397E9FDA